MRRLAPALQEDFVRCLADAAVPSAKTSEFLKWLRFYLDFCAKYRHPPRDPDALEPFLQKLASKNQSKKSQEEAAKSVSIFHELIRIQGDAGNRPPSAIGDEREVKPAATPTEAMASNGERGVHEQSLAAGVSDWDSCYRKLKEVIKVRQYSPKTLATYRIWTEQFQRYLSMT